MNNLQNNNKKLPKWLIALAIVSVVSGALLAAYFSWLAIPITIGLVIFLAAIILVFDKPWLGVLLVAFFLPFERIGGFDVVGQTTLKASQLFVLATIISWLFYYFVINKKAVVLPKIFWPILAYLGVAVLSFIYTENIERAISVFAFTTFVMIFALVIPQVVTRVSNVRKIILALLVSALLVSLFGLYQFAGDVVGLPETLTGLRSHYTDSVFGFPRIHSTALEPLYFANYLLIPIAIAIMLWLVPGIKLVNKYTNWFIKFLSSRKFILLVIGLGLLALILTLSRGGYLALIATLLVLLVLGWKYIWQAQNMLVIIGIVAAIAVVSIIFINSSGNFSLDTFVGQATEFETGAGIIERNETYDEAVDLFWQHPVIGIGIGNFGSAVAKYSHEMPAGGWLIVNNEPLELLVETGILGFSAILGLIIIVIWQAIRALRQTRFIGDEKDRKLLYAILAGLLAAFIGIIVQYQTFSTLYVLHVWFVIGMIVALVQIIDAKISLKT